jgi:UDP-N-acetylglucosamine 2-epimerase (non-hydrolysing)
MRHGKPIILIVFGTRPEAIKMFPLVDALRQDPSLDTRVAVTAQHRGLLDQVLDIAGITPDIDLDLMQDNQSLDSLSARILLQFGAALDAIKPDRILVHGDTLTTMMATLCAYFRKIPVGHVEAGLRSGNIYSPWPEEVNRKVTGAVADLHFAPTEAAAAALRSENVPAAAIHITGNTVIDALLATRAVRPVMESMLAGRDNVALIDPLDYPHFVRLMAMSTIVLTDSGGVQEEAPSLGKPVLVMRDTTERPEGVTAGTARLVGTDAETIVTGIFTLLDDRDAYSAMTRAHNPYGDGQAAQRIARIIADAHRQ